MSLLFCADRPGRTCEESEGGKLPLGICYVNPHKMPYHEMNLTYTADPRLFWQRPVNTDALTQRMGVQ